MCLSLTAVKTDWHTAFDAGKWILLLDAATLVEVYHYVKSAWKRHPTSGRVEDFSSKVRLNITMCKLRH